MALTRNARRLAYLAQTGRREPTPRQRRRLEKKAWRSMEPR